MKNTSLTTKLITAFILLAVMTYFGIETWRYFTDPILTTSVYVYRSEQAITLNGMLVRDEEVIDCNEPLVELTRAEGERVAKGKRVATVYQSAEALSAEQEVASLREQLEQLRYAQTATRDTEAALRLDSDIEGDIIAVRAALTPDMLPKLIPSEFEQILPAPVSTTVGKLVRGETWYYAAVIDEDEAAEIAKGGRYELAITGVDAALPVVADSVSRAEDGRCLAVFSGGQHLSYVTALRDQSAELILKSYTGLRIPKNALRINEGQSGVYCRIGRQ